MTENIEAIIAMILMKLGISPANRGFNYLRRAIIICISINDAKIKMTKTVYPEVAEFFGSTTASVERAMRSSIQEGWSKRDVRLSKSIFSNCLHGNYDIPSNSIFITAVREWILRGDFSLLDR